MAYEEDQDYDFLLAQKLQDDDRKKRGSRANMRLEGVEQGYFYKYVDVDKT